MNRALEAAGLLLRARTERRLAPAPLPAAVAPETEAEAYALVAAGEPLRAGAFVSTGATTAVVAAGKGDRAVAAFGALGTVDMTFV